MTTLLVSSVHVCLTVYVCISMFGDTIAGSMPASRIEERHEIRKYVCMYVGMYAICFACLHMYVLYVYDI